MNWDLSLVRFTRHYASIDELDEDAIPLPLGSIEQVQAAIGAVFDGTEWNHQQESLWGVWDDGSDAIEFAMKAAEPVDHLGLFVRADEAVIPVILDLAERLGGRVLDVSNGCFLTADETPLHPLDEQH